jgi:hypothetical protein
MRIWMTACTVGLAVLLSAPPPVLGQDAQGRVKLQRRAPLRIEVTPPARLYRQCVDWHVIERRATGDTVVPQARCWWALR